MRAGHWRKTLIVVGLALGGLQAYTARFSMGADGLSYLDVASAYLRLDIGGAISSYWSPLYSWLLAAAMALSPSNPYWEFPVVHFVNWICFVFTFWSFHRFWSVLTERAQTIESPECTLAKVSLPVWDSFGYCIFFYLFVPLVGAVTPDLLSAGFVFLIAEQALQSDLVQPTFRQGLILGVLLGFAYLAKAILLYFGFGVLVMLILLGKLRSRAKIVAACVVFLGIVFSWSALLHRAYGSWTVGASGRLNYAWFVDGTEAGFVLDPGGPRMPYFAGEKIPTVPPVFHVSTRPNVTFVPWFDPARFDGGRKPEFHWKSQGKALVKNLRWLREWFLVEFGAITVVLVGLLIATGRKAFRSLRETAAIWLPVLGVFALYSLVFIRSYRYIAAFTVVLFAILLYSVRLPKTGAQLAGRFAAAGLIVFALFNFPGTLKAIVQGSSPDSKQQVVAAGALVQKGISPNTSVGVIGSGQLSYWARLAHISISSVLDRDEERFWVESQEEQQRILCAMKANGSELVVGHPPMEIPLSNWESLGQSGYRIYRASQSRCDNPRDKPAEAPVR